MINKNSVDAVMALAQMAVAAGKTLVPQADTPLAELVKTSYLFEIPVIQDANALEGVAEALALNSNNIEHNARHDYLIEAIAKAASAHMDYARNIVLPAVEAVSANVQKLVTSQAPSPLSAFCLVMRDLPVPLQNDAFLSSVTKEASGSYIEPQGTFRFQEAGPMEVLTRLETGSKAFDDQIREWAAVKGDEFFTCIWNDLFRSVIEAQPENPRGFMEHITDVECGADAALAIFLLARRLSLKPEEGSGVDDTEYRQLCSQYQEVAAQAIVRRVEQEKDNLKKGLLIVKNSLRSKTLIVNGAVYRDWLRTGGKNEILFGLMVKDSSAIHIDDVTKVSDQAMKDWDAFSSLTKAAYRNATHNHFVTALRDSFYADLRAAGADEKLYQQTHPEYIGKVNDILEDLLSGIVQTDTQDIVRTVCRVVCKARFYFNDAYKILVSIDEAHKADPTLSVADAVATARAEYVVDFIAAQIRAV